MKNTKETIITLKSQLYKLLEELQEKSDNLAPWDSELLFILQNDEDINVV